MHSHSSSYSSSQCVVSLVLSYTHRYIFCFFFFNDTPTTEIYTLSLHDALPILLAGSKEFSQPQRHLGTDPALLQHDRSEEHTSELQSLTNLVCRLLLEKKKKILYISLY